MYIVKKLAENNDIIKFVAWLVLSIHFKKKLLNFMSSSLSMKTRGHLKNW